MTEKAVDTVVGCVIKTFLIVVSNDSVIGTSPVVLVFSPSPLSREGLLTLLHGLGVVKIPTTTPAIGTGGRERWTLGQIFSTIFTSSTQGAVCFGFLGFGKFLFVVGNLRIDHRIALSFGKRCQMEQRVLLKNDGGRWDKLVENCRTAEDFVVRRLRFVEQTDGFCVARLGFVEALLLPVDVGKSV